MGEGEDFYAEKMATIDVLKRDFKTEQTVGEVIELLEEECRILGKK